MYKLVKMCEYGTLREEMLRDHLVVGIRDATLSNKLQLDAKLTLEKMVHQKEAIQEHRDELNSHEQHPALEDVTRKTLGTHRHSKGLTVVKLSTAPTASKC